MEPEAKSLQRNTALLFRSCTHAHTQQRGQKAEKMGAMPLSHASPRCESTRMTLISNRSSCFCLSSEDIYTNTHVHNDQILHTAAETCLWQIWTHSKGQGHNVTEYPPKQICFLAVTDPPQLLTAQREAILHASHTVCKLYLHSQGKREHSICYTICLCSKWTSSQIRFWQQWKSTTVTTSHSGRSKLSGWEESFLCRFIHMFVEQTAILIAPRCCGSPASELPCFLIQTQQHLEALSLTEAWNLWSWFSFNRSSSHNSTDWSEESQCETRSPLQ